MRAVIVNCFDTYEDRVDLIHEYFEERGYEVTVIHSDFRHIKKTRRTNLKDNYIFVKSKSYFRNLSLGRLFSHYKFAKDAFKIVEKLRPDILYTFIPPNSLAKFASRYKKKNKNTKLIFDIIDLWPETMPVGKVKNTFPFTAWKSIRDKSFKYADFIITECDLYQLVIKEVVKDAKMQTVYLAKEELNILSTPMLSAEEIHLCYLGSINNIIDIPKIILIMKAFNVSRPTTLHVIGEGENKDNLINEVKKAGSKVKYYGKIYDPQEKQNIFDKCHFGLNIMKDSVCVGLTMKSIDYFQHGLPILNNIEADTHNLVINNNVGFNISDDNIKAVAEKTVKLNNSQLLLMRKNSQNLFKNNFTRTVFNDSVNAILEKL